MAFVFQVGWEILTYEKQIKSTFSAARLNLTQNMTLFTIKRNNYFQKIREIMGFNGEKFRLIFIGQLAKSITLWFD
jgi:hypothetical protein